LARHGPEALFPRKKQRRLNRTKPVTDEEIELVAKLLGILRDPKLPKDSVKQLLREYYDMRSRE